MVFCISNLQQYNGISSRPKSISKVGYQQREMQQQNQPCFAGCGRLKTRASISRLKGNQISSWSHMLNLSEADEFSASSPFSLFPFFFHGFFCNTAQWFIVVFVWYLADVVQSLFAQIGCSSCSLFLASSTSRISGSLSLLIWYHAAVVQWSNCPDWMISVFGSAVGRALDLAGASTGCLPRATAMGDTSALGYFADAVFLVAASSSDAAEAGHNVELNITA
ncbi:hypothetical protein Nepgr_005245 [Nepenthes gracilis]|uniref:Uncharacterized protein n=1 Tax=Nepenthes gracilis TaxID=150966 RepID=A0AAD3XGE5_NEPGR|nr:hypothetical protein Nepgr_005245 [Nepenthes gracilis]